MTKRMLLISILRDHTLIEKLTLKEWELVIRQARASSLSARLFYLVEKNNLSNDIPPKVYLHLESAKVISEKQHLSVASEIQELLKAFSEQGTRLILLKGAAYIASKLESAQGRLLTDIDILVPKDKLPLVEQSLALNGWFGSHHDQYDERYYRQWMHEIPPLIHVMRQSSLDVHHTILPPTAKYHPNPEKLFESAVQIPNTNVFTLSPEDMVIHSATHLFHEGEFNHGLRDLVDISNLIKEFSDQNVDFWPKLTKRATELDLARPLYYGIHYVEKILGTPIPVETKKDISLAKPNWLALRWMDFLFLRALVPDHSSCNQPFTGLAKWLLYIRSHYLRMPIYLLLPHLIRKSWKKRFGNTQAKSKMDAHNADDIQKEPA